MSDPVYVWQFLPLTLIVFGCGLIVGAVGAKARVDATVAGSVIIIAGAVLLAVLTRIWR